MTDLAAAFGERKFASALDSALYHCLDDDTKVKYLESLHGQARLACCVVIALNQHMHLNQHACKPHVVDFAVAARRGDTLLLTMIE